MTFLLLIYSHCAQCIAKSIELLEWSVLSLFWSCSSFEEKTYLEILQYPWKKEYF